MGDTRRLERRAFKAWEFESPLGHFKNNRLQARLAAQLALIRPVARFDPGACKSEQASRQLVGD
jgi:hypothetical protein